MAGMKFDGEKVRMDLLPPEAIRTVAKIFTFGANKYGDHNWREGINHSRLYAAVQRHLNSYWSGEDLDPESGETHLAHAVCGLLMMMSLDPEKYDDRYKGE